MYVNIQNQMEWYTIITQYGSELVETDFVLVYNGPKVLWQLSFFDFKIECLHGKPHSYKLKWNYSEL